MASLTMHTNNPGEELRLYFLGSFSLKNIALASHSGIFEGRIQRWGWYNSGGGVWTGPGCVEFRPPKLVQFAGHCTVLWCFCTLQSFSAALLLSFAINWNVQTFLLGLTGAETCLYAEGHVRSFGRVHCLKRQPPDIPLATQCAHSRCFLTIVWLLSVFILELETIPKRRDVFLLPSGRLSLRIGSDLTHHCRRENKHILRLDPSVESLPKPPAPGNSKSWGLAILESLKSYPETSSHAARVSVRRLPIR